LLWLWLLLQTLWPCVALLLWLLLLAVFVAGRDLLIFRSTALVTKLIITAVLLLTRFASEQNSFGATPALPCCCALLVI
jgi:hypothetical protein